MMACPSAARLGQQKRNREQRGHGDRGSESRFDRAREQTYHRWRRVFDKLKQWLAATACRSARDTTASRPVARRQGISARARWSAPGGLGADAARAGIPDGDQAAVSPAAVDQPCPTCGLPMLATWGRLVAVVARESLPRSRSACLRFFGQDPHPSQGSAWAFSWLSSRAMKSASAPLIQLTAPTSVLSRGLRSPTVDEAWFDFADEFMSCGHASVYRPASNDRQDSFAIRDRVDPGPSANGTFVASHKLGRGEIVKLSEGDIVRMGTTEMVFKSLWLPPGGQEP